MQLIQDRSRRSHDLPAVYALTTHSYTGLDSNFEENFEKVSSWIKEDITEKDLILVPIHKHSHWSLITFNVKEKIMMYHDSILGTRKTSNALKIMAKFFTKYWANRGLEISIKTKVEERATLQTNSYDCGVFVCENAEVLSREKT